MMTAPVRPTRGDLPAPLSGDLLSGQDAIPTVEVGSIIGAGREAVIVHKGERYRLRVTANDKLILTK
jgi:hemin uptake protein HemP